MGCRLAILGPANMQRGSAIKLDLRPFQIANLDRAQAMPIGDQDQGRVTVPVAAFARGPNKRFDLGRRQVLARREVAIAGPRRIAARTDRFSLLG